jgi:histo-blood group ABO system transferase
MKNIAIVTLATGEYNKFIDPLYKSIDEKFLPNHNRKIFVFSDVDKNGYYHIDALPWPLNTLLKTFYLNRIKSELSNFDYIYNIDSDCLVHSEITEEILYPEDCLVAPLHPLIRKTENSFETNPLSTAYVDNGLNRPYFQACFFGGYTQSMFNLISTLNKNIKTDMDNRIIAKWHDESHINKYLVDHPPKILDGGYAYPDPNRWPNTWAFSPKIIHYNNNSK